MSFDYVLAKLWNTLNDKVRNINAFDTFKRTFGKMPREFYIFVSALIKILNLFSYCFLVLYFIVLFL